MSFYNFVYTAPFPKDTKVTKEQIFEALRQKSREPQKFVPVIMSAEVLEETPTFIKRRMTTRDGNTIEEDIDMYAPAFVTFKGSNGALVINSIAEDHEGNKSLTFSFSFPLPKDAQPESEEVIAAQKMHYEIGTGAVHKSIVTTLELFEAGKL